MGRLRLHTRREAACGSRCFTGFLLAVDTALQDVARPHLDLLENLADVPAEHADGNEREVAERLASYNMLAVGVCDGNGRLLGAITVDDVLDRTLPADWRRHPRPAVTS